MIIREVRAENILNFSRLEITNIPDRCRIAITGPNESGKSAIVETIFLALFGRTVTVKAPKDLRHVVRWGEARASVVLRFVGRENHLYTVTRFFDSDGHDRASLVQEDQERPLAQDGESVNRCIQEIIGLDGERYLDTLYLSQQERSESEAHTATIKTLAGVDLLESVSGSLSREIDALEKTLSEVEQRRHGIEHALSELDLQDVEPEALDQNHLQAEEAFRHADVRRREWEDLLKSLKNASCAVISSVEKLVQTPLSTTLTTWRENADSLGDALQTLESVCHSAPLKTEVRPGETVRTWLDDLQKRISGLDGLLSGVEERRRQWEDWLREGCEREQGEQRRREQVLTKRRSRSKGFSALFFVVALIAALPWGISQFAPDFGAAYLKPEQILLYFRMFEAWVVQSVAPWQEVSSALVLPVVSGFSALVTLFFLVRSLRAGSALVQLSRDKKTLALRTEERRSQLEIIMRLSGQPLPKQVETLYALEASGDEALSEPLRVWSEEEGVPLLDADLLKQYSADLMARRKEFEESNALLEKEFEQQNQSAQQGVADCQVEVRRYEKARALWRDLQWIEEERLRHRQEMEVRHLAQSLIAGAVKNLSTRFNQELRLWLSKVAPIFTGGRYQHLQMDDLLTVQAFSTEKNGFVHFNELSTGTRHQLMLALRFTLIQALIARTGVSQQSLILDEPFAFFDRNRIQMTLKGLSELHENICQLWLVAPDFSGFDVETDFDLALRCLPEEPILLVDAG